MVMFSPGLISATGWVPQGAIGGSLDTQPVTIYCGFTTLILSHPLRLVQPWLCRALVR